MQNLYEQNVLEFSLHALLALMYDKGLISSSDLENLLRQCVDIIKRNVAQPEQADRLTPAELAAYLRTTCESLELSLQYESLILNLPQELSELTYCSLLQNSYCLEIRAWSSQLASFPEVFRQCQPPPPIVFVRGSLLAQINTSTEPCFLNNCISVIGARNASEYGLRVAAMLADGLSELGLIIVSGLAYGIDSHTQRKAMRLGAYSIAVMAGTLDKAYPAFNTDLFHEIASRGLLISERPPAALLYKHHFIARNRLIAALSKVLTVIEASQRSGSRTTVDAALQLGREVWALPGNIFDPQCKGCNSLIADGAMPLVDIERYMEQMQAVYHDRSSAYSRNTSEEKSMVSCQHLSPRALSLRIELMKKAQTSDELLKALHCSAAELFNAASELEQSGCLKFRNGKIAWDAGTAGI